MSYSTPPQRWVLCHEDESYRPAGRKTQIVRVCFPEYGTLGICREHGAERISVHLALQVRLTLLRPGRSSIQR